MPGHVLKCKKCGNEIRVGYSEYAVEFAAAKRGVGKNEIIEDFFHFNPGILRNDPKKCTKCGAAFSELQIVHEYP